MSLGVAIVSLSISYLTGWRNADLFCAMPILVLSGLCMSIRLLPEEDEQLSEKEKLMLKQRGVKEA